MLTEGKIKDYIMDHKVTWALSLPPGCPPEDILVPENHCFFRMTEKPDRLQDTDLKSCAEKRPNKDYGDMKCESFGLSLVDDKKRLVKYILLPEQKRKKSKWKGIAEITLNADDGVVKKTFGPNHYTWWMTTSFRIGKDNVKMVQP